MAQSVKHDYPGPSASKIYDARFEGSHVVPHLKTHVPQGLATWPKWNGRDDLLLLTAYSPRGKRAYVVGLDAVTGKRVGSARVAASHVGGIAVFAELGWAYMSSAHKRRLRRYALADLARGIRESGLVRQHGSDLRVFGASFLASQDDTLWAGRFDAEAPGFMRAYTVREDGTLSVRDGMWKVPMQTQGLVATKDMFVYSCSWGRGNRSRIYLVRRGKGARNIAIARKRMFRAPSMSEGMTLVGRDVFVLYESGARAYRKGSKKPRNIIGRLHKARYAALERLCP
jgi:hypothetical protein